MKTVPNIVHFWCICVIVHFKISCNFHVWCCIIIYDITWNAPVPTFVTLCTKLLVRQRKLPIMILKINIHPFHVWCVPEWCHSCHKLRSRGKLVKIRYWRPVLIILQKWWKLEQFGNKETSVNQSQCVK